MVVTHLLDVPVVVPDADVQLVHEQTMFLTVVDRAAGEQQVRRG